MHPVTRDTHGVMEATTVGRWAATVVNTAADDLGGVLDDPRSRDVIDLMSNAVLHRLDHPGAGLDEIARTRYGLASVDELLRALELS